MAVTGHTAVLGSIGRVDGKNMQSLSERVFPAGLLLSYPLKHLRQIMVNEDYIKPFLTL